MEFHDILRALRLRDGMTQSDLSRALHVSITTVRNWESGGKQPSMGAILALSRTFGVTTDALLGRTDGNSGGAAIAPISRAETALLRDYRALDRHGRRAVELICSLEKERMDAESRSVVDLAAYRADGGRMIPKYLTPPAAGSSVPLDGGDFEMICVGPDVPTEANYAVTVQGSSMEPYIRDGETVFVQSCEELRPGDVGIFAVDGATVCKQYYPRPDGTLMLLSANPALRQTNVVVGPDSGVSVTIQGRVLLGARVPLPDYLNEAQ